MAISDYIPNVFGQAAPSYLQGLLGAEETQNLQNRANVQGLLGAGLALAQGMSRTGPRRSAAENILGALSGGFGAAGGAYEQGVKNYVTQQQIAQTQLAQQDALLKRQQNQARIDQIKAIEKEDPALAQLIMLDPAEGAKQLALKQQLKLSGITGQTGVETPESLRAQALKLSTFGPNFKTTVDELNAKADRLEVQGIAPAVNQPPVVTPQVTPQVVPQDGQQVAMPVATTQLPVDQQTQEKILPAIPFTEKRSTSRVAALNAKADGIRAEMERLSDPRLASNKAVKEAFDRNSKKLDEIRKQIDEAAVSEVDLTEFRKNAPPQFQVAIDNLAQLQINGRLTPDQLSQRMTDISKQINDYKKSELEFTRAQTNYQNEVYRVGQIVAPGIDPANYTPAQIAEIQKRLVKQEKELRIAGRTLVTQNMYGDKEFLKRRIEGAVNAEEQAVGALNVANDVRGIVDVLKPYTGGKLDEFKAAIGSYLPDTSMAQIATANDLAVAIRARVAPTLRVPGSGATSDFETKQFLAAIPSLAQYANGRELIAVYTEKLAQRAVAAADLRSQMIESGTYSVKNFQQAMKEQGLDRVFTNAELATLRSGKTSTEVGSSLPQDIKDKYNLKDR
jgi:hypothetical protein